MTGVELIAAERARQVEQEGYTPAHDAHHRAGELAAAAAAYASPIYIVRDGSSPAWGRPFGWPKGWDFRPRDPIQNLTRAGALIAAELDRLLRAQGLL